MDHARFIDIILSFPQVWNRNMDIFRDKLIKDNAWEKIGTILGCNSNTCRDTFKSLREKYIREREKQIMYGDKYTPWPYLEHLRFLDPHIVQRKQTQNHDEDMKKAEELIKHFDTNTIEITKKSITENTTKYDNFDRKLIELVHKSSPIWDRKSNSYPSKQLKHQLWKNIGETLNKDISFCMLRWKGLREKYIRQKNKLQNDGIDDKWELLDDMSFLDRVIQYRKKMSDCDLINLGLSTAMPIQKTYDHLGKSDAFLTTATDDSSSDYTVDVKPEYDNCSYDSGVGGRKRSASDMSDHSIASIKRSVRSDDEMPSPSYPTSQKTSEQVFGDLVATMLAKKCERDKNYAMIEIMKILTK